MSLHIIPHLRTKRWAVRRSGSGRAAKIVNTKREAIAHAKKIGVGGRIYVHRLDGRVERKLG